MGLGGAYGAGLSGMELGMLQLLGGAQDIAAGNLDNLAKDFVDIQLGKVQFQSSEAAVEAQNQMIGSLLDMLV